MNKTLLASLVATCLTLPTFAQASAKVGVALDMDLSVVAQIDRYNLVLGRTGFAVDYIVEQGTFDTKYPLSWYVSGGGWAGWDDGYGIRVPAGVSWGFAKNWDVYGQVQPVANFDDKFKLSVDGAIGVRFSF